MHFMQTELFGSESSSQFSQVTIGGLGAGSPEGADDEASNRWLLEREPVRKERVMREAVTVRDAGSNAGFWYLSSGSDASESEGEAAVIAPAAEAAGAEAEAAPAAIEAAGTSDMLEAAAGAAEVI